MGRQLPKVKVKLVAGKGGTLTIDGVEIPRVTAVDIHGEVTGTPTVRFDMLAGEVEVDIEGAETTVGVIEAGAKARESPPACGFCRRKTSDCNHVSNVGLWSPPEGVKSVYPCPFLEPTCERAPPRGVFADGCTTCDHNTCDHLPPEDRASRVCDGWRRRSGMSQARR